MRSTSLMALVGLALVALLAGAEAQKGDIRVIQNGGLLNYNCRKCDYGYVVSPSKNQCIPDIPSPCRDGYGPNLYNNNKCTRCSDDNCKDCSGAFYDCIQCNSGYFYNNVDGECEPLLLQGDS
eukprot:jgi/Picsp_1/2762/NSC_00990-R1_---NA---